MTDSEIIDLALKRIYFIFKVSEEDLKFYMSFEKNLTNSKCYFLGYKNHFIMRINDFIKNAFEATEIHAIYGDIYDVLLFNYDGKIVETLNDIDYKLRMETVEDYYIFILMAYKIDSETVIDILTTHESIFYKFSLWESLCVMMVEYLVNC